MAHCREAEVHEDEVLACVLFNAFRLNWWVTAWMIVNSEAYSMKRDHNWWNNLKSPLEAVHKADTSDRLDMTPEQRGRLAIYRGLIRLTRHLGGNVDVVVLRDRPVAVSCWLPPNARPSLFSLWTSGMLRSILRLGVVSTYRLLSFQLLIDRLFSRGVRDLPFTQHDGAYVEILGTDPTAAGHGYGSMLLDWQIERHWRLFPKSPVFLDTNSDYAQRVYERLGFIQIGKGTLEARIDEYGCNNKVLETGSHPGANGRAYTFRALMLYRV